MSFAQNILMFALKAIGRLFQFSLSISFTVQPVFAFAIPVCESLFSNLDPQTYSIREKISQFRKTKIEILRPSQEARVNGISYQLLGVLGTSSSSTVFLARTTNGDIVEVKHVRTTKDPANRLDLINRGEASILYEIAATRYFRELGLPILKILDHEIIHNSAGKAIEGFLVKQYREGLTGKELNEAPKVIGLNPLEAFRLSLTYEQAVTVFKNAHRNFASWLKKNKIEIKADTGDEMQESLINMLITKGDANERNLLFDPQTQEWILFDP